MIKFDIEKVLAFLKQLNVSLSIDPNSSAKLQIGKDDVKGEINYNKDSEGKSSLNANFGQKS